MDLHYSQTVALIIPSDLWFHYLMDLHYSQTSNPFCKAIRGFTTLWIYTILKQVINANARHLLFHYLMDLHYSQTTRAA